MDKAQELVETHYPESKTQFTNCLACEEYLYTLGWVGFYARESSFRFRVKETVGYRTQVLTKEQIDFILENLENANNDDQKQSMLEVLRHNEAYQEILLLQQYDDLRGF